MAEIASNKESPGKDRPSKDRAAVQSGLSDLLGNVIQGDRQRSGRGRPPAPPPASSPSDTSTAAEEPDVLEAPASLPLAATPPQETPTLSPAKETPENLLPPPVSQEAASAVSPLRSVAPSSDIPTDTHSDIMTNEQADGAEVPDTAPAPKTPARTAPMVLGSPARRKSRPAASSPSEGRSSVRADAAEVLAATPTMTVTLRIPQGLNEWLDEYVHLSWPQKIRKQELVIEALRLLYARRGKAGEDVVDTGLLGEEEGGERGS